MSPPRPHDGACKEASGSCAGFSPESCDGRRGVVGTAGAQLGPGGSAHSFQQGHQAVGPRSHLVGAPRYGISSRCLLSAVRFVPSLHFKSATARKCSVSSFSLNENNSVKSPPGRE